MIKSNRWQTKRRCKAEIGRARGKESQRVQREKRATRIVDSDTVRQRALHDSRGALIRHGCDYSATIEKTWEIVRSVAGHTNQVDLRRNGRLFRTGRFTRAWHAVKWGVWKSA